MVKKIQKIPLSNKLNGFIALRGFFEGRAYYYNAYDIMAAAPFGGMSIGLLRIIIGFFLFQVSFLIRSLFPDLRELSTNLMREGCINCVPFFNTWSFVKFNRMASKAHASDKMLVRDDGRIIFYSFSSACLNFNLFRIKQIFQQHDLFFRLQLVCPFGFFL